MKRREIRQLDISDHAVLRWLERKHGLDIEQVKRHMVGRVRDAAELGALSAVIEGVRFVIREPRNAAESGSHVVVTTVLPPGARGYEDESGQ